MTPPKAPANPYLEAVLRYDRDPVLFAAEVLGMDERDAHLGAESKHTLDPEQKELLLAVGMGERRISVRSGHGVGKTTALAIAIVWHNCIKFPQRTVCTAPTTGQLFGALAAETETWFKKLPPAWYALFEIKTESIELKAAPSESFTEFRTSRPETPEALAGVHSGNVLLIADEASGVPEQVFEAASGSMSGLKAVTILAGNPVRTQGLFFDTHNKLAHMWRKIVISCVGHRRISPDFVEDMKARYGEDSNAYRVRVLGEFPKSDNDAVIPFDLMEAALTRDVKPLQVRPVWGVDVAGGGKDRSSFAKRRGNTLMEKVIWKKDLDTMQVVGWIKEAWDLTPASERPEEICVDAIGLGAGVADRLREIGLPARSVNVSELPALRERFRNLKTELWFMAREWFVARDCNLLDDRELGAELTAVNFEPPDSKGRLRLEESKITKKRLTRSPDLASAFVLTFAATASSALYGQSSASWNQPLKREIKGIV